jgi:hypothetical protein
MGAPSLEGRSKCGVAASEVKGRQPKQPTAMQWAGSLTCLLVTRKRPEASAPYLGARAARSPSLIRSCPPACSASSHLYCTHADNAGRTRTPLSVLSSESPFVLP